MAQIVSTYTVLSGGVGLPDYSSPKPTGQVPIGPVYTSTDVGELAARLKSCDVFDRRGNIVFIDDFEDGISNWQVDANGTGGKVTWCSTTSSGGGFCAELIGGSDGTRDAYIYRISPYPRLSLMGFEWAWSHNSMWNNMLAFIDFYDSAICWQPGIRYMPLTASWEIYNSSGAWQTLLTNAYLEMNSNMFNRTKLVVDFINKRYERLMINDQTIDLSMYNLYGWATGNPRHYYFGICVYEDPGNNYALYVDDVMITQNEQANQ